MKAKIEELETILDLVSNISSEFPYDEGTEEESIYYQYESIYRRFFDIMLLVLLDERNYQIPGCSKYYHEFFNRPGLVEKFHKSLLETELKKLNWNVWILRFCPGAGLSELQDEDMKCFIETTIEDCDPYYYQDYFDEEMDYMCIVLENKEIIKNSRFWEKSLVKKRDRYLSYIESAHDYCLCSQREVGKDRVRSCVLITEYFLCEEVEFQSANLYYCTPAVIIAAQLLDELCKAD